MKGIEIPFGAKDSELCGWEYTIPEGMEAVVKDGKVIVRRKESEDERIRKAALEGIEYLEHKLGWDFIGDTDILNVKEYLERLKEQPMSAEEVLIRAGLKPYRDGNQWCVLAGGNIQEGICGFGDTIDEALYQFLMEVLKIQKEQKPLSTEETERNSIAFLEQLGYTCIPPGAEQKPAEWSEEDEKMLTNMNRYIEVEKLKAEIERRNLSNRYITTEGYEQELYEIIASLQQEQPEGGCSEKPNDLLSEQEPTCKTCGFYENDCPFTRGKLMVYPNKVCKDYTHSAMKQEQLGVRCEPSLPSNLDEAAGNYAIEVVPDRFVPDEGNGYKAAYTLPDIKVAFKAGAEWMAGQFQKIEGCLVDWYSTSDGKEYCCGIKTDEAFEIPEGFYIRKKQ